VSSELSRLIAFLLYLPLYLTAFVGVALVLRLRRTHPRACWYAVAGGAALFLNWGATALMSWGGSRAAAWAEQNGLSDSVPWLAYHAVLSALQTTAAALLIAAILTGRRTAP
jgi:hypothetical protein